VNVVEYYALMNENGKMRPVETIPGIGGRGIKENDGGGNSRMTCCENFGKHHSITPVKQQQQKKGKNLKIPLTLA
jgi:hypothetical protein